MKPFALLLPLLLPLSNAAEPTVKLAGLQVIWNDGGDQFGHFKTYNSENGIGATLMVTSADKQIVAIDSDKGTLKIGGLGAKSRFFGSDSAFSKDRRMLRLEFQAEGTWQAAPDGSVKITGELPVTFATGKEATKSEPFAPASGTVVKFPAAKAASLPTLKIKSAGKAESKGFGGGAAYEIELTTDKKPDEFAAIRFETKDGKPLEANRTMSSWMGFGGKGSGEVTWSFKAAPSDLVIVIESWTGREPGKVKVDLSAKLLPQQP